MRRLTAFLVCVLLATAAYAMPDTVTLSWTVLAPNGQPATSGTVTAVLSGPATAPDVSGSSSVMTRVEASIGSDGTVLLELVPNDIMTPDDTYYTFQYNIKKPVSGSSAEKRRVLADPDPATITDTVVLDPVPGIASPMTTVLDEGTARTRRSKINFIGPEIECVDNSSSGRIDCTVTASSGGAAAAGVENDIQAKGADGNLDTVPGFTGDTDSGEVKTRIINGRRVMSNATFSTTGDGSASTPYIGWSTFLSEDTYHLFPKGVYAYNDASAAPITIPTGAKILCDEGAVFTFTTSRATNAVMFSIPSTSDDVVIDGCTFQTQQTVPAAGLTSRGGGQFFTLGSTGANNGPDRVAFRGNTFKVFPYSTTPNGVDILVYSGTFIDIEDNLFDASPGCINTVDGQAGVISNLTIRNNRLLFTQGTNGFGGAIHFDSGVPDSPSPNTTHVIIEGNQFHNVNTAIEGEQIVEALIQNNRMVHDTTSYIADHLVQMHDADPVSNVYSLRGVRVLNNTCEDISGGDTASCAIEISGCDGCEASDNQLRSGGTATNVQMQIGAKDSVISNNVVQAFNPVSSGVATTCVYVESSSLLPLRDIKITGNKCTDKVYAAVHVAKGSNAVDNIAIEGNALYKTSAPSFTTDYLIAVDAGATDVVASGNMAVGFTPDVGTTTGVSVLGQNYTAAGGWSGTGAGALGGATSTFQGAANGSFVTSLPNVTPTVINSTAYNGTNVVSKSVAGFFGTFTYPNWAANRNINWKDEGGDVCIDSGGGCGGVTVVDETLPALDPSGTLKFTGLGVTCTHVGSDNVCDVPAAPGGGDNLQVDTSPVTDPDFRSTGDVDFVNTANVVTGNINANAIVSGDVLDGTLTAGDLGVDSVGASELNATAVEAELEAELDLQQLQGAIIEGQVGNNVIDGGVGGEIQDDTVDGNDLAAAITFGDGDLVDFGTNINSATEGLKLPGNLTTCAAATGEAQVCWDQDSDQLYIGSGSAAVAVGGGFAPVDAASDTSMSVVLASDPTGAQNAKSDDGLTYDADTDQLTAGSFNSPPSPDGGGEFGLFEDLDFCASPTTCDSWSINVAGINLSPSGPDTGGSFNATTHVCTPHSSGRLPDACIGNGADDTGGGGLSAQSVIPSYLDTTTGTNGTAGQVPTKATSTDEFTWIDAMLVDFTGLAEAQGQIIYRNASGWVNLAPGSVGQQLTSGGPGANVSWATTGASPTEVRSMDWQAGAFSTDNNLAGAGTGCPNPTEVIINGGPKVWAVTCADDDRSTIYGATKMPDSWNGGTVTFTLTYIQTAANTSAMNSDIAAQCRGNGETPSSTYGTEVAIDDAAVTGSNKNDFTTSAAVTPAGTCAGGDMLYWRWQLDQTGTTTPVATLNFISMLMEYTSDIGD